MNDPCHFQTRCPRHPDVDDQQVRGLFSQACKRRVPRGRLFHAESFRFQGFGKELATHFIIIGNQNMCAHSIPSFRSDSADFSSVGR